MKHAFRALAKSPGFTAITICILALGIGANTAIFSVVRGVLLAPLPFPDAERVVAVHSRNLSKNLFGQGFAPAGYREFERQVVSFEHVAASRYNYTNLTRIERPVQLTDSLVTQDYFEVLGVKPLFGRTFLPADASAGAPTSVVLSYDLWQNHLGGQANIVGQTIVLDDVPHTVLGVMPSSFKDPFGIAAAWRVFPNTSGEYNAAGARFWNVIGRLKAGVPTATVTAELATIAARLAQADARFYEGWDFTVLPLRDMIVGHYRDGLLLVVGAALLVLLITSANVAGLQLVRASARERDVAVRLALGASRWDIARAQLAESVLLVAAGGVGGVLLGHWGLDLLLATLSSGWIPRSEQIAVDAPVLIASAAAALLTGLVFGLYPALRATKTDAIDALRSGAKGSSGPHSVRLRSALVVGQIALTLVLLVCAGLVLKSFAAIMRVSPGMQVENTLKLNLSPSPLRFDTSEKRAAYYRQLLERVRATPGIEAAAFTQTMPFDWGIPVGFAVHGRADDAEKYPAAFYDSVSASFFETARIPLLAGRTFSEADNAHSPRVLIISQATAKMFFPNEDPIGRQLVPPPDGPQPPVPHEIVGVVGDVPRNGLNATMPYQVYAPLEQRPWFFVTLLARSSLPADALANTVQKQIWFVNPDQPISGIGLVDQLVRGSLTQPQLYVALFSLFALLALLLAALGLYGLVAYGVAQRTREFGIRIALGARANDVLRLVLGHGAKLTAVGLLLGLIASAISARLMQSLLFRTAAYDPLVFAIVAALLVTVALLAAWLPARRATHVDPATSLRAE